MSSAGTAVQKIAGTALELALDAYSENPASDETVRALATEYGPLYFPELRSTEAKSTMSNFTYRAAAMSYTSASVYPGMKLHKQAASIQIPTLVLSGSLDVVVPPKCQDVLKNTIPNSWLASIEGAGHFPFLTRRREFLSTVIEWFKSIEGELK